MRSTIATDSILSELVQNKQDILWCWWPHSADQWPGPRGLTHYTLHTQVTPERNLSPGCLAQTSRLQMINGGPKFRSEAPQSGGQRQGYCLLTVDMSWHYYRDKASWREYCPLCGSVMWIYVQAFHGPAVTLSQNNNIVIRLWPLTTSVCTGAAG